MAQNNFPNSKSAYAPTNISSNAYSQALIVKASSGVVYNITGFSSKGTSQFIHLYNNSILPINNDIPIIIFYVGPLNNFSLDFGYYGRYFSNGIVICNSSTGPSLTTGLSDCWFDVQFK
jgi:hypothetical protein